MDSNSGERTIQVGSTDEMDAIIESINESRGENKKDGEGMTPRLGRDAARNAAAARAEKVEGYREFALEAMKVQIEALESLNKILLEKTAEGDPLNIKEDHTILDIAESISRLGDRMLAHTKAASGN